MNQFLKENQYDLACMLAHLNIYLFIVISLASWVCLKWVENNEYARI